MEFQFKEFTLGILKFLGFLGVMGYFFILRNSKIPKTKNITNFSRVLGAAAPKGLGRSPHKICELDLSSLKASKILEFLNLLSSPDLPCVILGLDPRISFKIPKQYQMRLLRHSLRSLLAMTNFMEFQNSIKKTPLTPRNSRIPSNIIQNSYNNI